jgi:hypothetical protein
MQSIPFERCLFGSAATHVQSKAYATPIQEGSIGTGRFGLSRAILPVLWRHPKLTEERAKEAARLVAEGLTLDAIAKRLDVHRRTILRWVERDSAFRTRYEQARRAAHQGLYDELLEAVLRAGGARSAAYAARRQIMRRVPKRHGRLPPEQRPSLLYRPRPRRADGT